MCANFLTTALEWYSSCASSWHHIWLWTKWYNFASGCASVAALNLGFQNHISTDLCKLADRRCTYIAEMRSRIKCAASFCRALIIVDVEEPLMNTRIIVSDHLEVAAKKRVVAGVESNDCSESESQRQ